VSATGALGWASVRGARRRWRSWIATRPRPWSRRSAGSCPVARIGSASSSARWLSLSRSPSSGASVRNAHGSVRGFPFGGSTSCSERAGVEQYSVAIQCASSTRSTGTLSTRTDVGATSFSAGTSVCSASPTTTPSSAWRPNGTRTIDPTPTGASGSA
jgi:hypothetical protein